MRKSDNGDKIFFYIWHFKLFVISKRFFAEFFFFFSPSNASPSCLYRFTRSHLGRRSELLDTEQQEVKCLWTRRCPVPSSIIYQSHPSFPFKCLCVCVRLGVQRPPHFDLTQHQQMLVERESITAAAAAAAVRFTGSLFEAKTLFAKIELCLTPSVWHTEAWNGAKLSAVSDRSTGSCFFKTFKHLTPLNVHFF